MGLLPCYTQLTRHEHPLDRCPRRRDEHPSGCKLGATLTLRKSTFLATNAPLEDPGAQLVREVASKTSDTAGDGTTTATVHAQAIFREGIKMVVVGANPMELKRGIEKAVEAIVGELKKMSKPVSGNMIGQVGTISANSDDTIGTIIAQAMEKVGKDGVITVRGDQTMPRGRSGDLARRRGRHAV